jgi:hypothetical protein
MITVCSVSQWSFFVDDQIGSSRGTQIYPLYVLCGIRQPLCLEATHLEQSSFHGRYSMSLYRHGLE